MIKFSELSWPLKVGVVGGWVSILLNGLYLVVGLVLGFVGV